MTIDVRAVVTCNLGELISASISDDYIQGSGALERIEVYSTTADGFTKRVTRRYGVWGETIAGQQAIAEAREFFTNIDQVETYLNAALSGLYLLDVTVETSKTGSRTAQEAPLPEETAAGTSLVTGALKAHKIRQVEGYLTGGTYANLLTWYDTTIRTSPATGAWFPIAAPTATAEAIVSGGVKSTRFAVQLTVLEII
jgi:hypothetical protein